LTLDHLDGRTLAARRCRDLIDEITLDLGNNLTASERELVRRAAVMCMLSEDAETRLLAGQNVNPVTVALLGNAARRMLSMLGLRRDPLSAPSPPTFEDRLVAGYAKLTKPEAA
jgi:hypothetical protein